MESNKIIVIIGAGPSGLCLAKELLKHPNKVDVIILERENKLGGMWYFDSGKSSLYNSMRTNLPREVMAFPSFAFDKVYVDNR